MLFLILLFCISTGLNADTISSNNNNKAIADTIITLKKKLLLEPTHINNYTELADVYDKNEMLNESNNILKLASELKPQDIHIMHRYACSCIGLGLIEQAVQAFQSILKRAPNSISILYNIGYTLKMSGKVDEAIDIYKKVLAADPNYEAASFALGHALLFKGDFEHGWAQHEIHLKKTNKNSEQLRQFLNTNTVSGKIILLRHEGGMGDTIQFIRYAQLLKDKGATVLASVQKSLVPLLKRCPYLDQVIPNNEPLPLSHDWATLMSLPAIFNSNEATIPKNIPYIYPDQTLIEKWQNYLKKGNRTYPAVAYPGLPARQAMADCETAFVATTSADSLACSFLKVGICWQADVFNDSSRQPVARRGIPLQQFCKLSHHAGVTFYSLQQKEGLEQLKNLPDSFNLHLFDDSFDQEHGLPAEASQAGRPGLAKGGAFMDTAAVMKSLDLVITVDTAIGHLAGALGTPVWLLLPYATDWRWIVGRTDSPWYPSMKIFKQPAPFDFDSVMHLVDMELGKLLQEKNR